MYGVDFPGREVEPACVDRFFVVQGGQVLEKARHETSDDFVAPSVLTAALQSPLSARHRGGFGDSASGTPYGSCP
jgi:hypothetical protein